MVLLRELMAGGGWFASADIASLLIHGICKSLHIVSSDIPLGQTIIVPVCLIGILTVNPV
jgi:hypothetical protein